MSGIDLRTYPFSAVCGMEDAKRALLCAAVSPHIRTVLIRGCSGTAKTVLARSVGSVTGRRVVNVPLNVFEEQLFGGLDVDATIRDGRPSVLKGLLASADGNILYVDDINLMDRRVLASLLDCVLSGRVILEREGVSSEYPCDTVLVATMNPDGADLSSHLLDRFDLCAYSSPSEEGEDEEILRRNMEFSEDPDGFISMYADEERAVAEKVSYAERLLPLVEISDELMSVAVELTSRFRADGFRGDLAMVSASKAIAALNRRDRVMKKDVEEAAMICLVHRRNYLPEPPEQPPEPPEEPPEEQELPEDDRQDETRQDGEDRQRQRQDSGQDGRDPPEDREDDGTPEDREDDGTPDFQQMLDDMMFEIGEQFRVIDYLGDGDRTVRRTSSRKGRRGLAESTDATGRYCRSRIPQGRAHDVAFDATIRAAAPYQRSRSRNGLSIAIEKQDIRTKVRERRSGCTVLFLVDASGSLGVRKRMSAVKGAVLSMLRDSYVKRDSVGLMAFRRDSAELILPPTRSVEYSYSRLEEMPTGGKTPLSEALVTVQEFMTSYSRSHQGEMCYVVLITDGRANVPIREGADANEEALRLAEDVSIPQVRWVVIDASTGYIRFDNAQKLAEALEGTYFKLEELNADRLAESVRSVIR